MIQEAPRAAFADELLARLERERCPAPRIAGVRAAAAAVLSASALLAVVVRRRGR